MRRLVVIGVALAALGLGWLGPVDVGPAPMPLAISAPRPQSAVSQDAASLLLESVPEVEASLVVEGLDRPTFAVASDDGRIFVTEKSGVIRIVVEGEILQTPFLDLDGAVPDHRPERGLLGIALHPDFAENGRFYVHLTDARGDSRLIEYRVSDSDPNLADPTSAKLVLAIEQPGEFHNGGMIQFGPDGYLWIALGDGTFGISNFNAALRQSVLGSILRIDVDVAAPYAIPADNPYVGTGYAGEIWVSGLRNPWRFFIDGETRQIVIGDVGQHAWEEIDVLPLGTGGLDLGWPQLEGSHCYRADACSTDGFTMPDVEYGHELGCAVLAGPIYRGSLISELQGMVVYSDFCTGFIQAFSLRDGEVSGNLFLINSGTYGPILSLAVDENDEVLLLTEKGEIRRLQPVASRQ